jgi:hypothetical protein
MTTVNVAKLINSKKLTRFFAFYQHHGGILRHQNDGLYKQRRFENFMFME